MENILDAKFNGAIRVIPVNCKAVMGKGLALEFKNAYPECFKQYQAICLTEKPEDKLTTWSPKFVRAKNGEIFLMFATKLHWSKPSEMTYIKDGLRALSCMMQGKSVKGKTLIFPKIGCGLGGLNWQEVRQWIVNFSYFSETPIYIIE